VLVAAAAFKACPELAAGEYRISLKLKLPHLASILDGHFVAGYQIWEGLGLKFAVSMELLLTLVNQVSIGSQWTNMW
jgi:hypothetical protein